MIPGLAPSEARFAAAMEEAARRRWRSLGKSVTLAAGCAAVFATLSPGGLPGADSLEPVDKPPPVVRPVQRPTHSPTPSPRRTAARPAPVVTAVRTGQAAPRPAERPAARPTPSESSEITRYPAYREDVPFVDASETCRTHPMDPPPTDTGWCGRLTAKEHVGEWTFVFTLCPTNPGTSVYWPTSQEVDFVVRNRQMKPLWTWSRGQVFDNSPHAASPSGGSCWRWTTTWDSHDDAGYSLTPGYYTATAHSTSTQLDGAEWQASVEVTE